MYAISAILQPRNFPSVNANKSIARGDVFFTVCPSPVVRRPMRSPTTRSKYYSIRCLLLLFQAERGNILLSLSLFGSITSTYIYSHKQTHHTPQFPPLSSLLFSCAPLIPLTNTRSFVGLPRACLSGRAWPTRCCRR